MEIVLLENVVSDTLPIVYIKVRGVRILYYSEEHFIIKT